MVFFSCKIIFIYNFEIVLLHVFFFVLHSVHTILYKNIKYDMLVYYFKHKQRKCIVGLKDHVSKVPLLYREHPRSLVLPVVGGTVVYSL